MASVDPVPGPALDLIPDPAAGLIPDPIPALDLNPDLAAGLIQDPIPGPALDLIPDSLIPDSLIPDPIPDPASSGIELFDPRTIWKKDLLAKQFVSELLVHKETSLHKCVIPSSPPHPSSPSLLPFPLTLPHLPSYPSSPSLYLDTMTLCGRSFNC